MKKRIKLTDTELALGMWLYITLNVAIKEEINLPWLKRWYLVCHNKDRDYWEKGCYLCEKYADNIGCHKCPLHKAQRLKPTECGCASRTWYGKICSFYTSKEERLSCCCKIVDVMRREV